MTGFKLATLGPIALGAAPLAAQASADPAATATATVADAPQSAPSTSALGLDTFASTDADGTDVIRVGINLDWVNAAGERYQGLRVEKALFRPLGRDSVGFERVYARYADQAGRLSWNAQVGTDGHTALGSINLVVASRLRKEFFVERDIIETPRGVREGVYYTFGGLAVDLPLTKRDTAAIVVGAQEFTGKNVRLHLRGTYIHVVDADRGLTAQLRGRYFHSTRPGEFDYFSPRWYAEIRPVIQLRRFSAGWRYLLAAGYGAQRDAGSDWRASRYLNAQLTSPARLPVQMSASLLYSNTPVGSGFVYDYLQGSVGLTTFF